MTTPTMASPTITATTVSITTMTTTTMVSPVPPSREEQMGYYYGLLSRPRLIARSSTNPWVRRRDRESTLGKSLSLVGRDHPIIGLWNDRNSALRQGITPIIRGIDWTDVRVLRIGYDTTYWTREESEQPVTLLIEVKKDSTSWEQAYTVVVACRAVLEQCGIHDVHVEIRQPREHFFQF